MGQAWKTFASFWLLTVAVTTQDTFNEKPTGQRKYEAPVEEEPTFDPFTNETDSSQFNDSSIIDEFNNKYLQRMSARSAAIALASLSQDLKECKDEEKQCSQWARDGYCFTNAGYMSIACQRSCDVCDLSVCADNHEKCEEWAEEGECSKNKQYMRVACRKSCGVCGKYGEAPLSLTDAKSSWLVFDSTDCYEGYGGDPVPGSPDPYSNTLTLNQCRDVCQEKENCEGIIRESSDGESEGLCYLRTNLDQSKCLEDSIWELHTKTDKESTALESAGQKSSWSKYDGVDCYEGVGGVAIQPDPYSQSMTLQACREACEGVPGCVGIIRKASDAGSAGLCYLRSSIDIESCVKDAVWDLHQYLGKETTTKPTETTSTESPGENWTEYEGVDCYAGAGGEAIEPDPYGQQDSLEQCKSSCLSDSSCVGIVRRSSDGESSGICYLRRAVTIESCDSGTEWTTHVNKRHGGKNIIFYSEKIKYSIRWINK